jgi:dTDP-4-dehydrorhamnose 3,5-epimerase
LTSNFNFQDLELKEVKLIKRNPKIDSRGFFSRIFCSEQHSNLGFSKSIQQINHSFSLKKGTIRGMHYQLTPHADTKLINIIHGEILNVVIDLRIQSTSYLKWCSVKLSENENNALLIPEGFAQGFQTLSDNVELIYCHTEKYFKDFDRGLNPFDPALSINWPLPVTEISDRDKNQHLIDKRFKGFFINEM